MSNDKKEESKKRLRQHLNPSIQGPNTEAVLESLATGSAHMIENVEAVNDSLYLATAKGRFLEARMADRNITKPDNVGLNDEDFGNIGIEIVNRKQVRDLMANLLRIIYGEDFTRATMNSTELEPYQLSDGDTLIVQFDDQDPVEIKFSASQFSSIAAATAQEVGDAITRELRRLGSGGSGLSQDNGLGGFVALRSSTDGPSSTVKVLGGKAQNALRFPETRPTSGDTTTQWTLDLVAGGTIRATWTGGPDPSIGKIKTNDYVNIFGTAFDSSNRGTFTITEVQGGLVGNAFVEFENPNGVSETTTQGTKDAILFFNPVRSTLNTKTNFAALYQTESRIFEVFMPATTRVVRRERIGSAHLHESGPSGEGNEGPYIFDTSKAFLIGGEEADTTVQINSNTSRVIEVDDASDIPDKPGNLIFGFGTSREEGPVPYIARPSSNTIIIDPSYRFENIHPPGTNVSLVAQNFPFSPDKDGSDFAFYATDIVSGRLYAEDLIRDVAAAGIKVVIFILFPNDEGLGKWGTENSEKFEVWGEDPT